MRATLLALLLVAVSAGCGPDDRFAPCIGAARYGDVTFTEVGFTDHSGTALKGSASVATCDAVEREGESRALRQDSRSYVAHVLPQYGPTDVILVQVSDEAWSVLVANVAVDQLVPELRSAGVLNAGEQ